ncbi:MAG: aminoglycoside phosphotransferase family protein [Thermomicrobiales bacterium]
MVPVDSRPVVTSQRDITASWLASTLRDGGWLPNGDVTTLSVTRWRSKTMSDLYRLEATYSQDVIAPASFILKVARAHQRSSVANRRRRKEHEFYARVAPAMDDPPVPRPFAAQYTPGNRQSHLLLEDLTATHWSTPAPLPPTPQQLRDEVDCLAHIHSWWWNHPDLSGVTAERDDAWIAARSTAMQRRLDRFIAEVGDHLPASTRAALETVIRAWPTLLARTAAMPLTVVHGDAHPWNFLTPRAQDDGRTCLLDWEGWSIEPGPHDLASLIALHLPVSERRALEEELVARYVGRLEERGVTGFDLATGWNDYRRAIARRVLSPAGLWSRGTRARSWWPALEHITAAYHDLSCGEVL